MGDTAAFRSQQTAHRRRQLIGSSNIDPRSLRLNFEFNVECYDHELATQLEAIFLEKKAASMPLTQEILDARSLPVRLRDGFARLATPFL